MPASMAYKTLFLQNLPEQITPADIKRFFVQNIKLARKFEPYVEKIGCIYAAPGETRKRTVVTFSSKRVAQEALTLSQLREISAEGAPLSLESGRSTVEIDSSFEGLTILFEPDSRAANIDIVLLHGITGHAWNTFAKTKPSTEHWIRDHLPERLSRRNVYPRIMTYGYDANIWRDASIGGVERPVDSLISLLDVYRRECTSRPLIFVAHSLGGIISKQAIIKMHSTEPNRARHVKGCVFFGVPNTGSEIPSRYAAILTAFNYVGFLRTNMIVDLELKSRKLNQINEAFRQVRGECRFPVQSCYETKRTKGHLVVEQDSAIFSYTACPHPLPITATHSKMIKVRRDDVIHALLDMVCNTATIQPNHNVPAPSTAAIPADNTSSAQPFGTLAPSPTAPVPAPVPTSTNETVETTSAERATTVLQPRPESTPVSSQRPPSPLEEARPSPHPRPPIGASAPTISSSYSTPQPSSYTQNNQFAPATVNGPSIQGVGRIDYFDARHIPPPVVPQTILQQLHGCDNFEIPYECSVSLTPDFVGRQQEIRRISLALLPTETSASRTTNVFAVCGLGGMGKTQLATKFADSHHDKFTAVFWVDGSSTESYQSGIAGLASRILGPSVADEQMLHRYEGVKSWLRKASNKRWLLVVDDLNTDPKASSDTHTSRVLDLPSGSYGSILITTRDESLVRKFANLELLELDIDESRQLLRQTRREMLDDKDVNRIAECAGHLPLALYQIGSFLRIQSMRVDRFLELWATEWKHVVNEMADGCDSNVLTTWDSSFDHFARHGIDGDNAQSLLQLSSYLDVQCIEKSLFLAFHCLSNSHPFAVWSGQLGGSDMACMRAIRILRTHSLIRAGGPDETYSMHPLVQKWCQHSSLLDKDRGEVLRTAVLAVASGMDESSTTYSRSDQRLLPHAFRVLNAVEKGHAKLTYPFDEPLRKALWQIGLLFARSMYLVSAEKCFLQALPQEYRSRVELAMAKRHSAYDQFDPKPPAGMPSFLSLAITFDLGNVHLETERFGSARRIFQFILVEALQFEEQGIHHEAFPLKLKAQCLLAQCAAEAKDFAGADAMLEAVHAACNKTPRGYDGMTRPVVLELSAMRRQSLGRRYEKSNEVETSLEWYSGCVRVREKQHGAGHALTYSAILAYAQAFSTFGKLDEVQTWLSHGFFQDLQVAGPKIWLAATYELATVHLRKGELEGAVSLLEQLLAYLERRSNPEEALQILPRMECRAKLALGLAYFRIGMFEASERVLGDALSRGSGLSRDAKDGVRVIEYRLVDFISRRLQEIRGGSLHDKLRKDVADTLQDDPELGIELQKLVGGLFEH